MHASLKTQNIFCILSSENNVVAEIHAFLLNLSLVKLSFITTPLYLLYLSGRGITMPLLFLNYLRIPCFFKVAFLGLLLMLYEFAR